MYTLFSVPAVNIGKVILAIIVAVNDISSDTLLNISYLLCSRLTKTWESIREICLSLLMHTNSYINIDIEFCFHY